MKFNIRLNLILGTLCLLIMVALMPLAHAQTTTLTCIRTSDAYEVKVSFDERAGVASFHNHPDESATFTDREITWQHTEISGGFHYEWSFSLSRMTGVLSATDSCQPTLRGFGCNYGPVTNIYQCQRDQKQF